MNALHRAALRSVRGLRKQLGAMQPYPSGVTLADIYAPVLDAIEHQIRDDAGRTR